ncbi:hypothetical protein [Psychrobacter sp. AOP31-E1-50]|uniref:hypothetical protein n=1 Tax=Psychrobacter sp. AOP31-E1-50 TaxID=3457692 RepID=UPI0040369615
MSQLLKLVKKGNRYAPTVYQLGANEHLNIHPSDQYADLTDASTGAYIRQIGWQGLRDWGYSPAKLLEGNETDQFLRQPSFVQHTRECLIYLLGGLAVALTIAVVGSITGCNNYVLSQLDKDIATSTSQPLLADSVNQDDLDGEASQQAETARHANKVIAAAYGREL